MSQLSLFGTPTDAAVPAVSGRGAPARGKLHHLDIAGLRPDPTQPRKFFDEQALADLQSSISRHGVLQPILVRKGEGGDPIIVSGERRYQAAKLAGLTTIPAIFTDGNPAEIAIIENLLRENLTAIEEAEAIERLRAVNDYQLGELSSILGKSVSLLSEILSLNRLPAEVKDDCRQDPKSSRGVLVEIARQRDPQKMVSLYQKYRDSGLTRGEIRKKAVEPKRRETMPTAAFIASWCERLDRLEPTELDSAAKMSLRQELEKLRAIIAAKLKQMRE